MNSDSEEPTLEQPLSFQTNSNLTIILIGIISITLIGGSSTILIINKKPKSNSTQNEINNFNLIANIENKVLQRTEKTNLIQKEIDELEPKIALKIIRTLKEKGFALAEIREKLLSNQISEETINKILA